MILSRLLPSLSLTVFILIDAGALADACKCAPPPDLARKFHSHTDVMRVKVLSRVTKGRGGNKIEAFNGARLFVATVLRNYKGKSHKGDFVILKSPTHSCGTYLKAKSYIVSADAAGPGVFAVDACGYNRSWKSVKEDNKDMAFLDSRTICDDGGTCICGNGALPVNCKADPCEVSEKCGEGECMANYCAGGCDAEWITDDGAFVCTKCEEDADCNDGDPSPFAPQLCAENTVTQKKECRTRCKSNDDCSKGDRCKIEKGICERKGDEEDVEEDEENYLYYFTCGDPVCRGHSRDDHPGVPLCNPNQEVGMHCGEGNEGDTCDPENSCNQELVCANSDPQSGPGGCPISRRATKRGINYLDASSRDSFAADLLDFRLATWNYKEDPADRAPRLGFIIDDVEPSLATDPVRDVVDVYGYLSMAVAAIQRQQVEIENLHSEVEQLQTNAGCPLKCDI